MQNPVLIASVLMVAVGFGVTIQSPINAALGRVIASPLAAATISFGVGFTALLLLTLFTGQAPALARVGAAPLWLLVGGFFGALFVFGSLWTVPILGVLTMTLMIVFGQVVAAGLLDAIGAFGLEPRPITLPRILAALCLLAGVVLSRY